MVGTFTQDLDMLYSDDFVVVMAIFTQVHNLQNCHGNLAHIFCHEHGKIFFFFRNMEKFSFLYNDGKSSPYITENLVHGPWQYSLFFFAMGTFTHYVPWHVI